MALYDSTLKDTLLDQTTLVALCISWTEEMDWRGNSNSSSAHGGSLDSFGQQQ